ncbi:hypothetical protein TSAR_002563, partial [Trichomalopsis sarcophagae]
FCERYARRGCATVSCGLVAIARGSSRFPEDDAEPPGAVTSNRHDGSADITVTQGFCWVALTLCPRVMLFPSVPESHLSGSVADG